MPDEREAGSADPGGPVAVVIQRRVTEAGYGRYAAWLGEGARRLAGWPGFVGQEIVPPSPPAQVDWVVVQRFRTAGAARDWLKSEERGAHIAAVRDILVGQEDMRILTDGTGSKSGTASVVVTYHVAAADEAEFLDWQREIQRVEAHVPGFLRHKIERPVPGVHDEWIIVLTFDSDQTLTAWLESPERREQLEKGARFNADLDIHRTSYGFDFWFRGKEDGGGAVATFKNNLIVLLVLYPVVFLWGYFVSTPLLSAQGVPFWLALFIGNLVSTQLLGWWAVPAAFRRLAWWLEPDPGRTRDIAGYALLAVLYALSMAVYAGLLAWNWGAA